LKTLAAPVPGFGLKSWVPKKDPVKYTFPGPSTAIPWGVTTP
jgi:hypothetical protein